MPLLDHFRPPLDEESPWEAVGGMWVTNVVRVLNKKLTGSGFRAEPFIHLGHRVEADVAAFDHGHTDRSRPGDGPLTAVLPSPVLTFVPDFPDEFEVRIITTRGRMQLVAVVEFVSPSNKDRDEHRRKFLTKCVGYLQLGLGLVIVDTVTNRHANFHNELIRELGRGRVPPMPDTPTYVTAFRPVGYAAVESLDVWPYVAAVGQPIPSVPLPLRDGPELMLDLESPYLQALADLNI